MGNLVLVYITNPSEKEAKRIAKLLLRKRLIACANIFPVKSMYWWKGRVNDDREFVLIAKILGNNFEKVKIEVEKTHPYEIPCIVKIPVSSNNKYFDWLVNSTK